MRATDRLKYTKMPVSGVGVWSCATTRLIIPHRSRGQNGVEKATFWRVPMDCPLPDDVVVKSETKADESEWVEIEVLPK